MPQVRSVCRTWSRVYRDEKKKKIRLRVHRRHVRCRTSCEAVRARVAGSDDKRGSGGCLQGRVASFGNKVRRDEKAHVFAFSIHRNSVREIVTRKCKPACVPCR